jgi:transposase
MSHNLNNAAAAIGIDIGKNSFHVVGLDSSGAIVLRQKWLRGQIEARLAKLHGGLRRCVRALHLSRKLGTLSANAGQIRAPLLEGTEERLPRRRGNR